MERSDTLYFADSSALTRCYLRDEPGSAELRELLLSAILPVVGSRLAVVEVRRALRAAHRARRLRRRQLDTLIAEFVAATSSRIDLIPLAEPTLVRAAELVEQFPLGTLDAVHLAVADREGRALAGDDELVFVTADATQGEAAAALGMTVRP